jgi:hypothetical protein
MIEDEVLRGAEVGRGVEGCLAGRAGGEHVARRLARLDASRGDPLFRTG